MPCGLFAQALRCRKPAGKWSAVGDPATLCRLATCNPQGEKLKQHESIDTLFDAVALRLAKARRVLFITGAGISADSGLPTYRGVGGLYNDELTEEGLRIEEALSAEVLAQRPDITWRYLAHIADNCRGALPNDAHRAIARLEERLDKVLVFTQNIDGLHCQAGSSDVIEIHGNLQHLLCTCCDYRGPTGDLRGRALPPVCPECGGVLRPEVVLFGEALPEEAMERLIDAIEEGFDMVFTIGTSSVFPYIVEPVLWAAESAIPTVEINPQVTTLSRVVDYHLPCGAAAAMQALMARLE